MQYYFKNNIDSQINIEVYVNIRTKNDQVSTEIKSISLSIVISHCIRLPNL